MPAPDDVDNGEELAAAIERACRPLMLVLLRGAEPPPTGISQAQLAALSAVERRDGLSMGQLAEEMGTIPSWASRICDRLEAEGYVQRRLSTAGRRQLAISIRPSGRRVLEEVAQRRRAALSDVLSRMSPRNRQVLSDGLAAFAHAARPDPDHGLEQA